MVKEKKLLVAKLSEREDEVSNETKTMVFQLFERSDYLSKLSTEKINEKTREISRIIRKYDIFINRLNQDMVNLEQSLVALCGGKKEYLIFRAMFKKSKIKEQLKKEEVKVEEPTPVPAPVTPTLSLPINDEPKIEEENNGE